MAASSSLPETMKAACSLDNPMACYPLETSVPVIHVTLLGDEWSSSAGGLSTINRELAIHLSEQPGVNVSLLCPEKACSTEEIREADGYGITIVEAKERAAYDRLDWLTIPPQDHFMDIVVGHGVKLGRQVQFIRDSAQFTNCKWVQVVHTAPEDLSRYKCYSDPISKGETKHKSEVELCKLADLVVPVGPRLKEAYTSYLQRCKTADQDVLTITPGLFQREFGDLVANQGPNDVGEFKVLLFGRGDDEDFELKGYNIAAQAFTDQRLKHKPYHLIFVGAPEGKQEEIRGKLLQRGIAEAQLTVRKFIPSRERLKDLLCEGDLAIMPSKSEGFGLVALEALSAGLPILVGSRSGFAKALENVPIGFSCIVNSDHPAKWAEAIEAVRTRHRMRLEEIKALRACYGEMYSWKEQCEALVKRMWKMSQEADSLKAANSLETKRQAFQGRESMTADHKEPFMENDSKPRIYSPVGERFVSETSVDSKCEKKADAVPGNQTKIFTFSQSLNSRKRRKSESSGDPDIVTRHCYQDLSDEQEKIIHEILTKQIQAYTKYRRVSTPDGVSALIEHIQDAYNLALRSVGVGSLEITFRCPSLERLESLWSDYQSGHLNDIAERYLVTDDIKKKLNLENVSLKTIIEEENYLICKRVLMEKSFSSDFSPSTQSDQEVALLAADTSSDVSENKKRVLTHMERAEKAKAARGLLHKAAISGQYETVKMLLESGEDVDQNDQFSLTPLHLACWYGQESIVILLLEHGANVKAKDRFQRTPLQKAERQEHHSIVQLLLKNDPTPSLLQPVSLKELSRKAFLQVDEQSGFNLLQAAVLEGEYNIVLEASGLLVNFLDEMEYTKTGNDAKGFSGKTAVDILSLVKGTKSNHYSIERLHKKLAENNSRLTELQWGTCNDDAEQAVELVLNDGVDINASGSDNDCTTLQQTSRSSSSQFIETLIDLGADVDAQRKDDKVTPLILATEWSNYMAACLLLRHGANVDVQGGNGFTALHVSVNKGHENLIRLLLKHKADVNIQDYSGHTPLHRCVTGNEGKENIGRLLLEHNADVNKQNQDGCTPLHLSVNSGFESLVRLFLELSADVDVQDKEGYTALHRSVKKNNENLARLLLKRNANANIKTANGYTPLHQSVFKGSETLVRLLLEHKADVNIQDNNGQTPLHWCHTKDNENLARLLLEHHADVNIQDNSGFSPLCWCAFKGNEKLCRMLLEHNADVNIQDYQVYTPLHLCVIKANESLCRLLLEFNADVNIPDRDGYTPLHQCVIKSNENLCRLFVAHNAEVNLQDRNGCTPLHKCVENGNKNLCKLLVEHNSDVNLKDLSGCTPLHWCVIKGNEDLCKLLLEHNADVNIQDESGCTPLHSGVREGNEDLCKLLLENNAEVNIKDLSGCTPLHKCVMTDNKSLCRLLLEHSADVNIQDKGGQTPLHQSVTKSNRYWYRDCSQIIDLLIKYGVQDIDIRDAKGRTPLELAVRSHNDQAVQKLLDLGADFSVVKADKSGAIRRERLKNTAERMERYLKFDAISVQETKETEAATSVTNVPGAEKLTESHFKSKGMLRQTPSHTTEKTEDKPKAEQAKTMGASNPKSMATSSSRTN